LTSFPTKPVKMAYDGSDQAAPCGRKKSERNATRLVPKTCGAVRSPFHDLVLEGGEQPLTLRAFADAVSPAATRDNAMSTPAATTAHRPVTKPNVAPSS
jgi:hypothetical protein